MSAPKEKSGSTENARQHDPNSTEIPAQSRPLSEVLEVICGILRRYVVFPLHEQATAIALWVIHTWVWEAFDFTPYLHVFSAEKRSGKS
jgi:hypothetical protein